MITVSLETAKKMKEAGWKKNTWFYYEFHKLNYQLHRNYFTKKKVPVSPLNAPTVQEILDELAEYIRAGQRGGFSLCIYKRSSGYGVMYYNPDAENKYLIDIGEDNIAEGAGKVWLWCEKNGYLPS